MHTQSDNADVEPVRVIAAATPGLALLVLYGSRARDDARADSDWDFAYLAGQAFDPDALLASLAAHLRADRIDLADLGRATGQLRYRVARDGVVIHEREPGTWDRFWVEAVSFWCDAGPVISKAYDATLRELGR